MLTRRKPVSVHLSDTRELYAPTAKHVLKFQTSLSNGKNVSENLSASTFDAARRAHGCVPSSGICVSTAARAAIAALGTSFDATILTITTSTSASTQPTLAINSGDGRRAHPTNGSQRRSHRHPDWGWEWRVGDGTGCRTGDVRHHCRVQHDRLHRAGDPHA